MSGLYPTISTGFHTLHSYFRTYVFHSSVHQMQVAGKKSKDRLEIRIQKADVVCNSRVKGGGGERKRLGGGGREGKRGVVEEGRKGGVYASH